MLFAGYGNFYGFESSMMNQLLEVGQSYQGYLF
jgi:hypothetical protein